MARACRALPALRRGLLIGRLAARRPALPGLRAGLEPPARRRFPVLSRHPRARPCAGAADGRGQSPVGLAEGNPDDGVAGTRGAARSGADPTGQGRGDRRTIGAEAGRLLLISTRRDI